MRFGSLQDQAAAAMRNATGDAKRRHGAMPLEGSGADASGSPVPTHPWRRFAPERTGQNLARRQGAGGAPRIRENGRQCATPPVRADKAVQVPRRATVSPTRPAARGRDVAAGTAHVGLGRGVGEARRRTLASFMIRGELGLPAAAALECWHPPRHRRIRLCSPARSLCEPVVHRRGRKNRRRIQSLATFWLAGTGRERSRRACLLALLLSRSLPDNVQGIKQCVPLFILGNRTPNAMRESRIQFAGRGSRSLEFVAGAMQKTHGITSGLAESLS